jgi:predicted RNA polymerase sigma factor
MLLNEARRAARVGPGGTLIPLEEQDRVLWDRQAIAEGVALVSSALSAAPLGPYQLQAAIAAVHAEAPTPQDTDWPQIVKLYEVLLRIAPNPMAALSHAVAVAMVDGPAAGLDLLDGLAGASRAAVGHRLEAVRAHLLDLAGDASAARDAYLAAARGTTSLPEQRYLGARAARVASAAGE